MSVISNVNPSSQSVFSSGLATVSAGTQRLTQDALQIANPEENASGSLLDARQASVEAQAGAAVLRTSNEVLGTLLNAFA